MRFLFWMFGPVALMKFERHWKSEYIETRWQWKD